ncbi:MAG: hypothetical protein VKK98_09705 [Cyanobacteriota bacterium]|nr:hypothetical protein [Cyanobacteriota bacterium]
MISLFPSSRALVLAFGLVLAAVSEGSYWLTPAAVAQVTVGYSNPIFVSSFHGVEQRRGRREQFSFSVAGINVRPDDGTLMYDNNTIWQINDPEKPFSLRVSEEGPRLNLQDARIMTRSASVQRTERVFVQISGPAADSLQSVFAADVRQRQEVLVPNLLISVFEP